jgi:hypothetical protein
VAERAGDPETNQQLVLVGACTGSSPGLFFALDCPSPGIGLGPSPESAATSITGGSDKTRGCIPSAIDAVPEDV